jgi:hypothetical protein
MEEKEKLKSVQIWFCVNRNGDIRMFTDNPTKNEKLGKWTSKNPFINSVLYNDISQIVKSAHMTFENNPEIIEMQIKC